MFVEGGTIRSGEHGEAVMRASIAQQLTRSEIIQLCSYEGFPQPFVVLCLDFLRGDSQAA